MSLKVLIVDTDIRFMEQARRYLEACGHYVALVDAERTADQAERWQADLVIANAELPAVFHGTLLTVLHDMPLRPAILLTASMDRFDLAWRAWQKGGDELLLKPVVHASELHHAIIAARQNAVCPQRIIDAMPEPVRLSA
jgi:CheY-like chemotaxis protein